MALDLQDFLPGLYSDYDPDGVFKKLFDVLTPAFNDLVSQVDAFPDLLMDPVHTEFIMDLLADSGNPFWFSLSDSRRRELLVNLLELYNQRGTENGCERAVRLIMKRDVQVVSFLVTSWRLQAARLGVDTYLSGPNSGMSFWVGYPDEYSTDQVKQVSDIMEFMAPGHVRFTYMRESDLAALLPGSEAFWVSGPGIALINSPFQVELKHYDPTATYLWSGTGATVVVDANTFAATVTAADPGKFNLTVTQQGGDLDGRTSSLSSDIFANFFSGLSVASQSLPAGTQLNVEVFATRTSGVGYEWTIDNGFIVAGQGTSAITLVTGAASTICHLSVTAKPSTGLSGMEQTSSVEFKLLPYSSVVSVTTPSLSTNEHYTGSVVIGKQVEFTEVTASDKCWFRLYRTAAARDLDLDRALGVALPSNVAQCLEVNFNFGNDLPVVVELDPHAEGVNGDAPQTDLLYYTVTKFSTGYNPITINMTATQEA